MKPQRKALLKPFELLGFAAVLGAVVFGVFLLTTRDVLNGFIAGVGVFIVSVVVLAMLVLSYRPNPEATVYLDRFEESPEDETAAESAKDTPSGAVAESTQSEEPRGDTPADGTTDDDEPRERETP